MRKYEFNYNICLMELYSDEYFMNEALKEAHKALERDEVPVGAVIVWNNRIIARAHNLTETLNDPTAHAEMQAFTAATGTTGGKYLENCTLFVTLEPCVMCAGAAFWTQVSRIVFGAHDEKRGYTRVRHNLLHPKTVIQGGILKEECSTILKTFFAGKREKF
jgi:tRNA(adenine34) deaminase